MEFFSIIMSYLLLFILGFNIRKIKFDFISISILWFCSYCFLSIFWGSQVRSISRVTLPFVIFFAIRVMVDNPKQIKLLLTILLISYCYPIVGSLYQIIQGSSIGHVEYITGIERYTGMFKRIHPFSYAMLFFSVFYYIQVNINQLRNRQIKWALLFLLIISFYCLFKTYARNSYLGLFVFWTISLWGYNKKYFYIILISALIIGLLYLTTFQQIFFKTKEFDANVASSGRLFLWGHNISLFLASSFDRKLLGYGLGVGSTGVIGADFQIWASHNDFLQLLMALGSVGLLAYVLIFLVLLKDVYMYNIDKSIKYFYYGIIFSITLVNLASGITLYEVGLSQQFWLIMGLFYVFRDLNETSSLELRNGNLEKSPISGTSKIYV